MSYQLKIKAKHLAEEARIIKFEERKTKLRAKELRELQKPVDKLERKHRSLYLHRMWDVKREARATNLARAYIAGKKYSEVERNTNYIMYNDKKQFYTPDIKLLTRVSKMVSKYQSKTDIKDIVDWLQT